MSNGDPVAPAVPRLESSAIGECFEQGSRILSMQGGATMITLTTALVAILSPAMLQGTPFAASSNPLSDALRDHAKRAAANLAAAAELMPAEKYGYHPTEAQMTFGQLIVHVVQTNMAICSGIAGTASPMSREELGRLSSTQPKEELVNAVKRSLAFCTEAATRVTDAQLAEEISIFGRKTGQSRGAAMMTIAADWADHYSTAASYLRQNGILPPTAHSPK
jgi:uncharacterized damage-inducible protein DinB